MQNFIKNFFILSASILFVGIFALCSLGKIKALCGQNKFKESGLLKKDDNLADKSGNESYRDYTISRIYKSMTDRKWHVVFTNGSEIIEGSSSSNKEQVWALQLEWLIRRHFENKNRRPFDLLSFHSFILTLT